MTKDEPDPPTRSFLARNRTQAFLTIALMGAVIAFTGGNVAASHQPSSWVNPYTGVQPRPGWCPSTLSDEECFAQQAERDTAERSEAANWQLVSVAGWLIAFVGLLLALLSALANRSARIRSASRCPHCRETVRSDAVVCKHCGRDLATR